MASKETKAVDIFMQSLDSLPGKVTESMSTAVKIPGIKILTNTKIDDLPTLILRSVEEDLRWAAQRQLALRKAMANLFRKEIHALRQRQVRIEKQSRDRKKTAKGTRSKAQKKTGRSRSRRSQR